MAIKTGQPNEYVQAIHAIFPGIDICSARQLAHDGEFNDILVINEELVFRFPRYPENIPGFLREIQLLAKLQPILPLPIPNPIYTSELGKGFMGYRLIPGQPFSAQVMNSIKEQAILQGLARQMADFLSILHRQTAGMLGLDLPLENMPEWLRTFFKEVREHLFPYMRPDASLALTEYFEVYFNTPDLQRYQPAIIHGDFGGSNILIDGNQISGILDFSAVCYSDPALDIAAISTYTEPFFSHFCQFYPVNESLLRRAEFYRGIFALEEALYGWKNNDKKAFERGLEQYI